MLGLYVSDHPLFGKEAALRRKVEHVDRRSRRARRRGDGAHRRRRHRADAAVHQARRPDGDVHARGPRRRGRGDAVPAHAHRAGPQARRRHHRRRPRSPRQARREPHDGHLPDARGARRARRRSAPTLTRAASRRCASGRAEIDRLKRDPRRPIPAPRRSCSTSAASVCASPTTSASTSIGSFRRSAWPSGTTQSPCRISRMASARVQTNDASALTDSDLDEFASMGGAFGIGELSKAKEDWVLITTARIDGQAARFHVLDARAHRRHPVRAARPDQRQAHDQA